MPCEGIGVPRVGFGVPGGGRLETLMRILGCPEVWGGPHQDIGVPRVVFGGGGAPLGAPVRVSGCSGWFLGFREELRDPPRGIGGLRVVLGVQGGA